MKSEKEKRKDKRFNYLILYFYSHNFRPRRNLKENLVIGQMGLRKMKRSAYGYTVN